MSARCVTVMAGAVPVVNLKQLCLLAIVLIATFTASLSGQDRIPTYSAFFWDVAAGEGGTLIRYGNWYGPGWWGASEDPKRVGMLPPIDALDKIAQKHDFGYQVAEELGKHRPEIVAYYKAMADGIAVRDAMALPKDPARWVPPAKDIALARRYRDRIAVGFGDLVQNWNALLASNPMKRLDPADPADLELILAGRISDKEFEARALALVSDWEKKYKQWQIEKAAKRTKKPSNSDAEGESVDTTRKAWEIRYVEGNIHPFITLYLKGTGANATAKIKYNLEPLTDLSFDGRTVRFSRDEKWNPFNPHREEWQGQLVGDQLKGTVTFYFTAGKYEGREPITVEWYGVEKGGYEGGPAEKEVAPTTGEKTSNVGARTEPTAIMESAPSTSGAVSVGPLDAKAIARKDPAYPAAASAAGVSGEVEVEILVDTAGNVESAEAVSGHPLLRASAEKASRSVKFRPHVENGRALKVKGTLTYKFKLDSAIKEPDAVDTDEPLKEDPDQRTAETSDFSGTYDLVANGYPATLEITGTPGNYTGRVLFQYYGKWETLTDVEYAVSTATVSFTRPRPGGLVAYEQNYSGKLNGITITGTFLQQRLHSFEWRATRK